MQSATKAFTLIEVLVSVMILAVVGTGLLQLSTNSKHNFIFLKKKYKFDLLASIPFIHNDQKYHHKDMSLYDFVRDDYRDIDDSLRQYLKSYKISYSQEEISTFHPLGEENKNDYDQEDSSDKKLSFDITIIYDKIIASKDNQSSYTYKVYIPMVGK